VESHVLMNGIINQLSVSLIKQFLQNSIGAWHNNNLPHGLVQV